MEDEEIIMELQPLKESNSLTGSNTENKNCKKWRKNKTCIVIAILFASAAVITTLCLILYSYVYVDEDEMLYMDQQSNGSLWIFKGSLQQMDRCQWEPELRNQDDIKRMIKSVYETSSALKYYFISSEVEYSDESNTSANFTLNFKVPLTKKPFLEYAMNNDYAGNVLRQFIYDQDMSWCNISSILLENYYTTSS